MAEGLANSGFDIDLRNGVAWENAFVHAFLQARVEHKYDKLCRKTGNVFVEFEQKGRPSGIAVTTADYWATCFYDFCWIVLPAERMKQIARHFAKTNRTTIGGDFNNYKGVLVPVTELVRMPSPSYIVAPPEPKVVLIDGMKSSA